MPLLRPSRLCRWTIQAWVFLGCLGAGAAAAGSTLAVFYPRVSEPYSSVFQTIIDGIQTTPGFSVTPYALPEGFDSVQLEKDLQAAPPAALIALGKTGYLAAKAVNPKIPVVFGALRIAPDGLSGISLTADPARLFLNLQRLVPTVRQVHVVFEPTANAWLIQLAEGAARAAGLHLVSYPVADLREAVHRYRTLLKQMDPASEAIWLPFDNVSANDEVVLPMLLQTAWDRGLVLFSSKPAHAQRGVLFSMFPDNYAMGKRLAEMAQLLRRPEVPPRVVPLSDLQLAVNLRTAAHLGLQFSSRQQASFDLTFPPR